MAGYLFNLDSMESLRDCLLNGMYSTRLSRPIGGVWLKHHEATFADYVTMKPGDSVYFFIKRKIFGIGELVELDGDCRFENYPGATEPKNKRYEVLRPVMLIDTDGNCVNQRWVCAFKPSPVFFTNGIDMDELLQTNPTALKMVRAFWKVSFIKMDDEESQAFKSAILKKNQDVLLRGTTEKDIFVSNYRRKHNEILCKLRAADYRLKCETMLINCANGSAIRHEMAIEAALLTYLKIRKKEVMGVFGKWDYLSHQVIASPFKPIDYMDKMDIYGYSYLDGFAPTKRAHLVIEIKKDEIVEHDVEQVLKYVDWVRAEYCFGDYATIKAYLVGNTIGNKVADYMKVKARRLYTVGSRPAETKEWNDLHLVTYSFEKKIKEIRFTQII